MAAPATPAPPRTPPGTPTGRTDTLREARRTGEGAVIGGVCAGLARSAGIDPLVLRIAFLVVTALTGGLALAAYLIAWGVMPAEPGAPRGLDALGWRTALGAAMLVAAVILALQELDTLPVRSYLFWPAVLTTAGVVLLWRAGAATTAAMPVPREEGRPGGGLPVLRDLPGLGPRTVAGIGLIAAGLVALLEATDAIGTLRDLLVATLIVLAGVTLIFGSSWLGLLSTLREERAQRIRSDERAELAAHLHDSVLQTLALIQRRAGDDREVAQLARRQERELRDWLAGRTGAEGAATTLADALRAMAAEVEERHAVTVEVITVGDAPLDDHVAAVVRAASEAAVNAAKFAGTGRVDVFAEATDGRIEVFVRDRGTGFDPQAVPADRRGVRESIIGRMDRHGGRAVIRSAVGEGTEVELVLERTGGPS